MNRFLPLTVLLAAGCGQPAVPTATPPTAVRGTSGGHDHEHTRDKMMVAHAGPAHAWLTAHLSAKDGNELDVFFEGEDDDKPLALPVMRFTATAARADGQEFALVFEPAPADERPRGEAPGTCSHFVAKAPGLVADDVLTVTAEVTVDGRERKVRWKGFVPRKFAHHID